MNKQEKLAELHSIRTTLDKVAKGYCATSEERKTVKEISMRLFQEQILPLAEEMTADLVKSAKILAESNSDSTLQLIDLGLPSGTLWADRNIGADSPKDSGDYFRFGETTPFTEDSEEYNFRNLGESIAGTEHDAATVILGKKYRMPTLEQIKELLNECKWEWTTQNDAKGMKVTGPNGNSIFFPASGYRNFSDGLLYFVGYTASCWSASANRDNNAHYFYFTSITWGWSVSNHANGFPVRAVASSYRRTIPRNFQQQ